jgi:hypothetical protein
MLYVPIIDSLLKNFSLNFKKIMWFGGFVCGGRLGFD